MKKRRKQKLKTKIFHFIEGFLVAGLADFVGMVIVFGNVLGQITIAVLLTGALGGIFNLIYKSIRGALKK